MQLTASHRIAGTDRRGKARRGAAWRDTAGLAGLGVARHGTAGKAWLGSARQGQVRHRRPGTARLGAARLGMAPQARRGPARHGVAGRGQAPQAWRGAARPGEAGRGRAPQAWQGVAWRGKARHCRPGMARSGRARHGKAPQACRGWAGSASNGSAWSATATLSLTHFLTMDQYKFRNGWRVAGVDAQTVGDELRRIYDGNGELTAPLVVDEARPDDAPLHPAFEWNDEIAAELHREHQARTMIRSVEIIRNDETHPSFVHVSSVGSYIPGEIIAQDVDLYETAWRDAADRLGQAQHALLKLQQLAATRKPTASTKIKRALSHVQKAQEAVA